MNTSSLLDHIIANSKESKGNEPLATEVEAFHRPLKFHHYFTMRSYINETSFYLKNVDFTTLETCYSNHTSLKIKADKSVSFQKVSTTTFFDNCYYVSTSKIYMLYHFISHHHVKNLSFPDLSHMYARYQNLLISQFQVKIFNLLVFLVNLLALVYVQDNADSMAAASSL